jgi:hypothetical protein
MESKPNGSSSDDLDRTHPVVADVRAVKRWLGLLAVSWAASVAWLAFADSAVPDVISVERLEIVEPDGNLAFVLANSQRPAVATIDGQVIMEGQEEERRLPSFVFFDGKGDEVGGMLMGTVQTPDGYSATRHLSLDGYKQDQTVVLRHYQGPNGSSAGLAVSDRPLDLSILDALEELGLEPGSSREELQAAVQAIPEDQRAVRARELFGTQRLFVGSARDRSAMVVLHDGQGRPRIRLVVPDDGEPTIQVLDERGEAVLSLPE